MSLTHSRTQGAALLATLLAVACVADPGEAAKPAFVPAGEITGSDDASDDVDNTVCPPTRPTLCGQACVDTSSSADDCGSCGTTCSGGATCVGGHCTGAESGTGTEVDASVDGSPNDAAADVRVDASPPDAAADARADASVDGQAPPDASSGGGGDAQGPCPACTGCCDTGGNCSKGTSATACGAGGVYCIDCTASSETCHTGGACR